MEDICLERAAFDEGNLHPGHRSIRLKGFDYSSPGFYFVTICCDAKRCVLGSVTDAHARLSQIGKAVQDCWVAIPAHFSHTKLHEFVIMPNHVHGIIEILRIAGSPRLEEIGRIDRPRPIQPRSLSAILRSFKSAAAKNVYRDLKFQATLWQRNFYERVLRDADELANAQRYILENPEKWEWDNENPDRRRNFVERFRQSSSI